MLNIKIHIFTYRIGGNKKNWSWKTVSPDPDMARYSDFSSGTVPDMLLYNSDNTHYDLLVQDHSRLAVLGLISMEEEKKVIDKKDMEGSRVEQNEWTFHPADKEDQGEGKEKKEQWKTVETSKRLANKVVFAPQKTTLIPDKDIVILNKNKQKDHKRVSPQSTPVLQTEDEITVNLESHI